MEFAVGECRENQPRVKLFFALMAREAGLFEETKRLLTESYGPLDLEDEPYAFDPYTGYYEPEFGSDLRKVLVAAEQLIAPEQLVEIKRETNAMERSLGAGEGRSVNIDPGYLNHSKVVLATTKDQAHRLYIGRGIFEEITLGYHRNVASYQPNPWTYPDYRAGERLDFFNRLRQIYCRQVKSES